MLGLIIEDTKNNTWSQLFVNRNNNELALDGFTVTNGVLSEFNKEYLKIFNTFLLSDYCEKRENINGYEVIYDKINNFYHFFKDGKEDFNKFFLYNSEPAIMCLGSDSKNSLLRKFFITVLGISLVIDVSFGVYVLKDFNKNDISETININQYSNSIRTSIFDNISYKYGYLERVLKDVNSTLELSKLISSSEFLTEEEKSFLNNLEFISMVGHYYVDSNFEAVSLIRHTNMKIESFTGEEYEGSNGYYQHDEVLHLRDYDVQNIIDGNDQCRDLGHEHVHSFQVPTCPIFIMEASAEVMSHEFFLKSGDMSKPYSYPEACKYLKILMEIVGPEVIKESNFKLGSYSLNKAVIDYFSDEEYREFFDILNLSPFWDSDQLREGKYDRLDELLNILYRNKYNAPMEEDEMISAIVRGGDYNRPYFSESLKKESRSYYLSPEYVSVSQVNVEGVTAFVCERQHSREEFGKVTFPEGAGGARYIHVVPLVEVKEINTSLMGLDARGTVTLLDGTILNAWDAQNKGIIRVEYYSRRIVSEEEFLENYETDKDYKCKLKIYVPSIDEKMNSYNIDEEIKLK